MQVIPVRYSRFRRAPRALDRALTVFRDVAHAVKAGASSRTLMATRQFCAPKFWWWRACQGAWYGRRRAGSSFRRIRAFLLRLAFLAAVPDFPGRLGTAHPFRRRIGFRLCRWRANRIAVPLLACGVWLYPRASGRRAGSFAYRQSALAGALPLREKWRAPCARLRRGLSTMGGR